MLDWDIYGAGGGAGAGGDGGDATIVAHGAFMGGGGFDPEDPDEVFGGDGGAGVTMPNGDGTTVNVGGGGGGGANNNDFGYSGGGGAAGGASGRGANSETPSNDYAAESGTNYRGEGGGGGAGEYSTNTYSTGGNGGHGYAVITHDAANTPLNCTPAPHATGVHNGLRYYQFRVDTTITL